MSNNNMKNADMPAIPLTDETELKGGKFTDIDSSTKSETYSDKTNSRDLLEKMIAHADALLEELEK